MIYKILNNKTLSFKNRIKNFVYYISRRRGAKKSWENRHQKVIRKNREYSSPCEKPFEESYLKYWSSFRKKADLHTVRICKNISGNADVRMIPEDLFVSDIEPSLTIDPNVAYISNKSFYNRWFQDCLFPEDYLHCVEGQYLNRDLNEIPFDSVKKIAKSISYPVVFKPNRDSYGGAGVKFIKSSDELLKAVRNSKNFLVQEQIRQHPFYKKFNPVGLNTVRVYLYRSVKDNQLQILAMALRMGKDGSLDNETAGGIHTRIRNDGTLNGYAVDKYGNRFEKHPNTGLLFNEKIPDIDGLKRLSIRVASQVFLTRIIGLDACYDSEGMWRTIEINTHGHATRFAQYGGQPFFGEFTGEVLEFCREHHWTLKEN